MPKRTFHDRTRADIFRCRKLGDGFDVVLTCATSGVWMVTWRKVKPRKRKGRRWQA